MGDIYYIIAKGGKVREFTSRVDACDFLDSQ
jgi:hypothetical protein